MLNLGYQIGPYCTKFVFKHAANIGWRYYWGKYPYIEKNIKLVQQCVIWKYKLFLKILVERGGLNSLR